MVNCLETWLRRLSLPLALALVVASAPSAVAGANAEVRLKDLGRFLGWRDNQLVGYGIVTGLAGSGDSPRNQATRQALANLLSQFDVVVGHEQIQSRNVAMVMVTAVLPPVANPGDALDINVTSTGDARSLAGGTLIMAPLRGPDRRIYALAQGPVSVGGYRYDANGNLKLKNHPTVGIVPRGGTVEVAVRAELIAQDGKLRFVLRESDSITAQRIAQRINGTLGSPAARAVGPDTVEIDAPADTLALMPFIARVEALTVEPDQRSRVVVNERTGTVVAGGDTRISPVTISHGDIRVSVTTEYSASQPNFVTLGGRDVRSLVIANSELSVDEAGQAVAVSFPRGTVGDLVQALAKARVGTRDVIAILQAIKAAGALYAELVIQ
ncbi:TPA: flagellar basal body P-ring protein FlgI [Burkholderia cenocepacia]|uniref:flagellar basal body P-ring protein FlgI n=1 Tax=unclassified Burkholderia TaxID=2613784 RepID=UPI00158CF0C2|nr:MULTISPECIES: flagellar basal body P-ring protein FlgI [unclassified Burkholderia]HEF5875120.1 flagellar basal body P-ring protein FlgI [Burkholderia cenocepacia]